MIINTTNTKHIKVVAFDAGRKGMGMEQWYRGD